MLYYVHMNVHERMRLALKEYRSDLKLIDSLMTHSSVILSRSSYILKEEFQSLLNDQQSMRDEIRKRIGKLAPAGGGSPRQHWKKLFVTMVADIWTVMMGKPPPRDADGKFAELVSAAWLSLCSNAEVTWDSDIRRLEYQPNLSRDGDVVSRFRKYWSFPELCEVWPPSTERTAAIVERA
jgi:hypothetical protein